MAEPTPAEQRQAERLARFRAFLNALRSTLAETADPGEKV